MRGDNLGKIFRCPKSGGKIQNLKYKEYFRGSPLKVGRLFPVEETLL